MEPEIWALSLDLYPGYGVDLEGVDSSRSGRSSGSGGTAGSIEEGKEVKTETRVVGKAGYKQSDSDCWREDEEGGG